MTPYFVDEKAGITIYHGDCSSVMPNLLPFRADHIITDPPYDVEAHTSSRRLLRNGGREIVASPLEFAPLTDSDRARFCMLAANACRGWILTFCQAETVASYREALNAAGASYKRAMVWVKPDGVPQYSGDKPGMGYESIVAAWFDASSCSWNGGGKHGVFHHNKNDGVGPAPHLTTKPLALMKELVTLFTSVGETVLDPYMGSGTTLRAAKDLGRHAIGIEIEERYCEIAARRLAQEVLF